MVELAVAFKADSTEEFDEAVAVAFKREVGEAAFISSFGALGAGEEVALAPALFAEAGGGGDPDMPVMVKVEVYVMVEGLSKMRRR